MQSTDTTCFNVVCGDWNFITSRNHIYSMDKDTVQFVGLLVLGTVLIIGALAPLGISIAGSGGGGSLIASAFAAVDPSLFSAQGELLVSFDNFENVHTVTVDQQAPLTVFSFHQGSDRNIFWMGTDRGLWLSRDGGLTWNRFITSNNQITAGASVFSVLPVDEQGKEYYVSVYQNGVGTVYHTQDEMFSLEKVVNFEQEVPYDMYLVQDRLYFAMSTGQLMRYNITRDDVRVVNVFSSPVTDIMVPGDGYVYLSLGSGKLIRSDSLVGEFSKVRVPSRGFGGLFGASGRVASVDWANDGTMYVLSGDGVYMSTDHGVHFTLFKSIPLTKERIDALSVYGTTIHLVSDHRLFTSVNRGNDWSIQDLPNRFKVAHMYFVGGRIILGR